MLETVSWQKIMSCLSHYVRCRSIDNEGRSHTRLVRPSTSRWVAVEDLSPGRQFQFWVTAVTNVGEGMSSNVVTMETTKTGERL